MIIIIILYLISFGLSLLNSGAYWDDWAVIVNKDPELIKSTCYSLGQILAPYLFNFINIFHSYSLYRAVTFSTYLLTGYFLYSILKNFKEVSQKERLLLIIFFLLFPSNDARTVLVIFWYNMCYFFFFFGWWLISRYLKNKNIFFRLFSLISFLLSFSVNSILFFYIIVLAYIAYQEKNQLNSYKNIFKLIVHNFDLILLPIVFYLSKNYFFPLSEINKSYNEITLINFLTASYRSLEAFGPSFIVVLISCFYSLFNMSLISIIWQSGIKLNLHPYVTSLTISNLIDFIKEIFFTTIIDFPRKNPVTYIMVLISTTTLLFVSLKRKVVFLQDSKITKQKNLLLFILGCVFFYVAVFPYYVVNKPPSIIEGFSDRHLLLVPLGASFMIVYGVRMLGNFFKLKLNFLIIIYSIFIVIFVNYHLRMNIDFLKDWYKQVSFIEQLKINQEIKNNTTFIFIDNTIDLNVKHRPYAFYEYTGFMRMAFGNERRFGSSINEFITLNNTINEAPEKQVLFSQKNDFKDTFNEEFNMKDYILKNPEFIVEINYGSYELSDLNLLYLIYFEHFDKESYSKAVKNIVQLSVSSIPIKY